MEKTCFECGEPIRGRSDKKFCADMCRNSYNNRLNSDCNNLVRNVNNVLRRNRRIIGELLQQNNVQTSKSNLVERGFNFLFSTSSLMSKKGVIYYFCYEFGYFVSDKETIVLVQKNDPALLIAENQLSKELAL